MGLGRMGRGQPERWEQAPPPEECGSQRVKQTELAWAAGVGGRGEGHTALQVDAGPGVWASQLCVTDAPPSIG